MSKFINPHIFYFYNDKTNQKVKYYVSTNIMYNMYMELEKDIRETDALIVSGYHPNNKLFDYFDIPKIFYGSTTTYFGSEEASDSTIITWLHENLSHTIKYFSEYHLVNFLTNESVGTYNNIKELNESNKLIKMRESE